MSDEVSDEQVEPALQAESSDSQTLTEEGAGGLTSFTCRHCGIAFQTRQGLGGHASKKHPGQSETYQAKVIRRSQRKNDRLVLGIAKDLLKAMTSEKEVLDPLTAMLFKRQRRPRTYLAKPS